MDYQENRKPARSSCPARQIKGTLGVKAVLFFVSQKWKEKKKNKWEKYDEILGHQSIAVVLLHFTVKHFSQFQILGIFYSLAFAKIHN